MKNSVYKNERIYLFCLEIFAQDSNSLRYYVTHDGIC